MAGYSAPYFTKKFRGYSQVGSNHILWNSLFDIRVPVFEFDVPFPGIFAVGSNNSFLRGYKSVLNYYSEKAFKFWDLSI